MFYYQDRSFICLSIKVYWVLYLMGGKKKKSSRWTLYWMGNTEKHGGKEDNDKAFMFINPLGSIV